MRKNEYGITDVPAPILDEDILQVKKYIIGLENFIKMCPTPMSIALQGDWGTGKTTFLKTMENDFSEDSGIKTIYFNTWQYSQFNMAESLYTSFLNNIILQLVPKDSELEKTAKTLLTGLWKVVKGVAKDAALHAVDSKTQEIIGIKLSDQVAEIGVKAEKEQARTIKFLKEDYAKLIEDVVKEMKEKRKKEHKTEKEENGQEGQDPRIVIFVDDLDRLEPARAVEMLEVLKLFMDVRNCVYVLAIDYDVVVNGVRQKYGSSMTEDKCRSFFDKIIQLPFSMPVNSYHIDGLLRSVLQGALGEEYLTPVGNLISQTLGMNPRTLKRLANSYYLLESVEKVQMGNDADRTNLQHALLLLSLVIQMYNSMAYEDLARCRTGEALQRKLGLLDDAEDNDSEGEERGEKQDENPERAKADMALGQLGGIYRELEKISKKKDLAEIWVREIHLSSITNVSSQEKSTRSSELFTVIIGKNQMETKSAAAAFGYIVEQLLLQYSDEIGSVLKRQENWISTNGSKRKSNFRAPREIGITYQGNKLYVGTSNGTPYKVSLLRGLCEQLHVSKDEVKWLQGEKDLLA